MNNAQQTAITNHCRLAVECVHPRFARRDGELSFVVTVNSGYE